MKNYLVNTKKVRNIDFTDIAIEAHNICNDIISTNIGTTEFTENDIRKKLTEINCEDINIDSTPYGFEISCYLNYTPNSKYCITSPFKQDVHFCLEFGKKPHLSYGCGSFTITIDGKPEIVDIDYLHAYYIKHPERFDKSLFCNL